MMASGSSLTTCGAIALFALTLFPHNADASPADGSPVEAANADAAGLLLQGNELAADDRFESAIEKYQLASSTAKRCSDYRTQVSADLNGARAMLDVDRGPEASMALESISSEMLETQSATALQMVGMGELLLRTDEDLGQSRRNESASRWLEAGRDRARQEGTVRAESLAVGLLGHVAELNGQMGAALSHSRIAADLAEGVGALDLLYRWQWQAARALDALGEVDRSLLAYEQALETLNTIRQELSRGSSDRFRREVAPLFFDAAAAMLRQAEQAVDESLRNASLQRVTSTIERLRAAEIRDYFDDECVIVEEEAVDIAALGQGAAVIYPIIFDDRLEVLTDIGGRLSRHTVDVRRGAIRRSTIAFRRALVTGSAEAYRDPARDLFNWLIAPAMDALKNAGVDTLVIVPDGPLRSIPLAALWTGEKHLVEEFAIATSLGLSLTNPAPLNAGKMEVLASGLSVAAGGQEALPSVESELAEIQRLFEGPVLLDQDFRVDPVLQELSQGSYDVVHIATHGKFASDFRDSYLQAYDGRISLDELEGSVSRRRYLGAPLELLVLSACETAVGDERAALGLAGIALKAGARSAVATLWSVSDSATAELTAEFYRQLTVAEQSKAEALRSAQLSLIRSEDYAHPRLWSPYLILGNWL